MEKFLFHLPTQQKQMLISVSEQTGLSYAEWLRKMIPYCMQSSVLNELMPSMSGYIKVEVK